MKLFSLCSGKCSAKYYFLGISIFLILFYPFHSYASTYKNYDETYVGEIKKAVLLETAKRENLQEVKLRYEERGYKVAELSGGSSAQDRSKEACTDVNGRKKDCTKPATSKVLTPVGEPPGGPAVMPVADELMYFSLEASAAALDSAVDAGLSDAWFIGLIVIGAVIFVVLFIAMAEVIYQFIKGEKERWWEVNLQNTMIFSVDDEGYYRGLKFSFGTKGEDEDFGIAISTGYLNALFNLEENRDTSNPGLDEIRIEGNYFTLGPIIRAYNKKSYYYLESQIGAVNHDVSNVMGTAKLGYNFPVGDGFRLGLDIGSMYLRLDSDKSIVRDETDFNFTMGMELGYKF